MMIFIKLIDLPKHIERLKNKIGVYILRWAKNGNPVPIERIGGVDSEGILYIGVTERKGGLAKEISRLKEGILRKEFRLHTAVKSFIFQNLYDLIKIEELELAWIEFDIPEKCIHQKWLTLKHYIDKFKELPPLNLNI